MTPTLVLHIFFFVANLILLGCCVLFSNICYKHYKSTLTLFDKLHKINLDNIHVIQSFIDSKYYEKKN